jgi:hypothetical protein
MLHFQKAETQRPHGFRVFRFFMPRFWGTGFAFIPAFSTPG